MFVYRHPSSCFILVFPLLLFCLDPDSVVAMDARNRSGPPSSSFQVCRPSLFSRQPPRVLIVDASPPWWSETGTTLCEALDNFLTLACSLDGPCRLPLLSLYALSRQHECLLPFVVRGKEGERSVLCYLSLFSLFKRCMPDDLYVSQNGGTVMK